MKPRVLNKRAGPQSGDAVFIGRPSAYGNPFPITRTEDRATVIRNFGHWIHQQDDLLTKVRVELRGKDLLCFCAPQPCHGDILLRIANVPDVIASFSEDYAFLSNFYYSPIRVFSRKANRYIVYPTSEHMYQAHKTEDIEERIRISELPTAGQAKRAGQKLRLRGDWLDVRIHVMRRIVFLKFKQNPALCQLLADTRFATLIEGNYWNDTFWGVCRGKGQNHLGQILMDLRQHIINCKGVLHGTYSQ